jgi:putative membrane protein
MLSTLLIVLVILLHILFAALEMVFWTKPLGRKVFATNEQFAKESSMLAANQGLYNLFLVAGLCWGLCASTCAQEISIFFLCCVICAGIFGGVTASRKILLIQAFPGAAALCALLLSL